MFNANTLNWNMRLTKELFDLISKLDHAEKRNGKKGQPVAKKVYLKLIILDILNHSGRELTIHEIYERIQKDDRTVDFTFDSDRALRYHLRDLVSAGLLEEKDVNKRDYSFQEIAKTKVKAYQLNATSDELTFITIHKTSLELIESWRTILDKYSIFPIFEDLVGFAQDYRKELEDQGELQDTESEIIQLVEFDSRMTFREDNQKKILRELLVAIEDRSPIDFSYTSSPRGTEQMKKPKRFSEFHPYMIREHRYRWYLVGMKKPGDTIFCLDVDRITSLDRRIDLDDFQREEIPKDLWEHSMGIYTNWENDQGEWSNEPIDISFRIKDGERYNNLYYLESAPIHHSQQPKKLKKEEDGYASVKLKMFPDPDLVRKLRSMGNQNLEDIQPPYLSKWVKED